MQSLSTSRTFTGIVAVYMVCACIIIHVHVHACVYVDSTYDCVPSKTSVFCLQCLHFMYL